MASLTSAAAPARPGPPRVAGRRFATWDGAEIFYRAWLPEAATSRALIILHRGHEHSGRMLELVERLGRGDMAVFAWDQRGHGQSPGERGGAQSLAAVVRDVEFFARHLVAEHGIDLRDTILLAHSVGGVIGAAWVHDYAPPLRGMILATPAFRVKLYVPLAVPALRLKQRLLGGGHVKSYVKSRVLTHDPEQQKAYNADPAIFRQIAVNILLDLHDAGTRLMADAGAITAPTLILSAGSDWVVKTSAQRRFYEGLGSRVKEMEVFEGFHHAIFHERDRGRVFHRIGQFIEECFARPRQSQVDLLAADRGGHTRMEYDRLRQPTGPAGALKWAVVRGGLRVGGKLSEGVGLGHREGFDSGVMLDYVYANRPAGRTPLGRMIDRNYLNSPGWAGIRVRRENLQRLLRDAIGRLKDEGRGVHILDIAAGAGRYVLETLQEVDPKATAELRDYKEANLAAARRLADELGVADRVQIAAGDAFERAALAAVSPRATIGIVSGLYELFPENEPVRRSLAGLAEAIEPGGYLVYTCQPRHPQLEFIARALVNREGKPWVMRRRTQGEMDALVREAGFEKVEQMIDRWGIFTVSLARRVGS